MDCEKELRKKLGESTSRRTHRRRVIVLAVLGILLLASCAAWYTLSPYLSAEYFDPMPTPEEACAYVACNSDYDKVEFVSYIRSEDDTTK